MNRCGHTLVEVVVVVALMAIVAIVAVPRLQWGAVTAGQAEATARKLLVDLRRARSHAIAHALQIPEGCALRMTGASPYDAYRIVSLGDSEIIAEHPIAATVRCTGGSDFEFGTLGQLKDGSDTQVVVAGDGKTFVLNVTPATGIATCSEQP
jgi:prepilin-type N-terminal cleavage/methylation domain-containing protein